MLACFIVGMLALSSAISLSFVKQESKPSIESEGKDEIHKA